MNRSRRTFPTIIRISIAVLVFAVVLFAAGCGKPGNIYGSLGLHSDVWDMAVGGFPLYVVPGTYYQVNPGTYEVLHNLWDGQFYYPGPDATWYYDSYYTVSAKPGVLLGDGKDSYFQLYLGYYGLEKYGEVRSLQSPTQRGPGAQPRLGTQSWTQDGLLITVTTKVRQLTADELSKLQKSQIEKKAK